MQNFLTSIDHLALDLIHEEYYEYVFCFFLFFLQTLFRVNKEIRYIITHKVE